MPGFAVQPKSSAPSAKGAAAFNPDDIDFQVFYGFRYDVHTGKLTVEKIDDGSAIRVPDPNFVRPDDYRQWVLTQNSLEFSWDPTYKTRLLVEVK